MADVGSLGEYKVVVTADYSQLQAQFKAMAELAKQTATAMAQSLDKTLGAMNSSMVSQLNTMTNSMQNAFSGMDKTVNSAGKSVEKLSTTTQRSGSSARAGSEGFKAYASAVREAEKAEQNFRKQQGQAILAAEERAIAGRTAAHKAAWQEIVKQEQAIDKQRQADHTRQQQRIRSLQTQYNVAYAEINKYLQTHAKMSEAVFIRLQGKISAIAAEMRRLGAMPVMRNPLEGMDYDKYASQFSRLNDALKSLKHHLTWMASAVAIGGIIGIPIAVSKAIESFDALQTKIMQNMELADQYEGNTQKLHSDMNRMGEAAKTMAQGFGVSLNEVQEGMQIITRRYKDASTAIYLTSIALQMSKLDMVDTKQSAKDLEAVMLQFGMGAKDAGKFLNDFSVICHVARISGTDMLMALERSGSAFKAMNMDARAAMAAIAAVSTVTGKSGATIGESWKSILANLDFKKATAALDAYNIKLYEVGQNGAKTMRSGTAVLSDILGTFQKLDDEGKRKLATAIAGGRLAFAA